MTADDVIKKLKLVPLPEEGGFYRETFRSKRLVQSELLGEMSECTCIYYLITPESFSGLHWVDQDEIFHFYAGDPVEMFRFTSQDDASFITIGNDIVNDEVPQVIVPPGVWQGTKLKNPSKDSWALLGCTVAPGFEIENFHIKSREELTSDYPSLKDNIAKYTNF
jgi:predicted cupin superfamily sugar epimerase